MLGNAKRNACFFQLPLHAAYAEKRETAKLPHSENLDVWNVDLFAVVK